MTKEQVTELNCKKHIKIYLLKEIGLSNKESAVLLNTNVGHVYNVLKKYNGNEELKQTAKAKFLESNAPNS